MRTHTPAPAHTQTHTAARRPAVVFSQRDEMGGRWGLGEGRVVSERSTCERGEMTVTCDERR